MANVTFNSSNEVKDELKLLRCQIARVYGSRGRIASLQPIPGGCMTITNHSSKILQLYKTSNPLISTLLQSVQSHLCEQHEFGKYIVLLTTSICLNMLELNQPRRRVCNALSFLMTNLNDYLTSNDCSCCFSLDWSSNSSVLSIIETLLNSRPLCKLEDNTMKHTASLILQAFVNVIPSSEVSGTMPIKDCVHIIPIVNRMQQGSVHKGIAIPMEYAQSLHQESCLSYSKWLNRTRVGNILTAIFNISLAGDQKDGESENIQLKTLSSISVKSLEAQASIEQLLKLGSSLIKYRVTLVICQKCVHPQLRSMLEENGTMVIERVGNNLIDMLISINGDHVISTLSNSIDKRCIGSIQQIDEVHISDKQYLLLNGGGRQYTSLFLMCHSEIISNELKSLVHSVLGCLEQLLYSPFIFCGGGCTETILANYISKKEASNTKLLNNLHCDPKTFSQVTSMLSASFLQLINIQDGIALTDSYYHHCWNFPSYEQCASKPKDYSTSDLTCACGGIQIKNLPCDTTWITLKGECALENLVHTQIESLFNGSVAVSPIYPVVCDPFTPKISAIHLSRQMSTMILQTYASICN